MGGLPNEDELQKTTEPLFFKHPVERIHLSVKALKFLLYYKLWKKSISITEKAIESVPEFGKQLKKMNRSVVISGKSQSTYTNYARCLAHMGLHFKLNLLELDDEQILDYLHFLKRKHKTPSDSFFKHTVYGLRYLFRLYDKQESYVILPSIERQKNAKSIMPCPTCGKGHLVTLTTFEQRGPPMNWKALFS